jgi:DNA-directed RNA polymerase subunit RPC12/RpoP
METIQVCNGGAMKQESNMSWGLMLCLSCVALVLAFGIVIGTDLIPAWGKWYAKDLAFRRQTQALQAGCLAVDTNPKTLTPAMAWTGGGISQTTQKMFCPSCGGKIKFASQDLGRKIPCPLCKTTLTLRAPENLKMACSFCKDHIEFPAHALGQKIPCPHCNMTVILKEPA